MEQYCQHAATSISKLLVYTKALTEYDKIIGACIGWYLFFEVFYLCLDVQIFIKLRDCKITWTRCVYETQIPHCEENSKGSHHCHTPRSRSQSKKSRSQYKGFITRYGPFVWNKKALSLNIHEIWPTLKVLQTYTDRWTEKHTGQNPSINMPLVFWYRGIKIVFHMSKFELYHL
jgi:hypothetical protein